MSHPLPRLARFTLLASLMLFPAFAEAQRMSLTAEELRTTLKVTRPEEERFVDDVVDRVNNANRPLRERLPAAMVESTFQWARSKHARHRFEYFRRALAVRAAKIGVRL